ncbi:MAG: SecDF P1 head subdomain-containing protein [Steroidobacteraceae bacterium]
MLEFARWKYWLVAVVLVAGAILALPNVFGEDAALQVVRKDRSVMTEDGERAVLDLLRGEEVAYSRAYVDEGRLMVHFDAVPEQLKARDIVNENLGRDYLTALSFASRAPDIIRNLGLRPMPLGLDLRGGLYLLYQVDINGAVNQILEVYEQDLRRALTQANVVFGDVAVIADESVINNGLRIALPAQSDADAARDVVRRILPDLTVSMLETGSGSALQVVLPPALIRERQDYAIQQNLTTLRNRVNELGVAEPVVQRQGLDRIVVQLPGVQNSAEVKDILGKVATLEFRLVDTQNSISEAVQRGRAPLGSKLYETREGQPTLLKRDIIVTGDQLIDAVTTATEQGPGVSVTLDAAGGEEMLRTTRSNLGKPMGVVFIEQPREEI